MGVSLNKCPTVLAAGGGQCLAALAECQQHQQFLQCEHVGHREQQQCQQFAWRGPRISCPLYAWRVSRSNSNRTLRERRGTSRDGARRPKPSSAPLHGRLSERQGTAFRHTRRDYGGRLHGGECAYLRFMCRGRAEKTPGGNGPTLPGDYHMTSAERREGPINDGRHGGRSAGSGAWRRWAR